MTAGEWKLQCQLLLSWARREYLQYLWLLENGKDIQRDAIGKNINNQSLLMMMMIMINDANTINDF